MTSNGLLPMQPNLFGRGGRRAD